MKVVDPDILSLDDLASIRTGAYAKNLQRQLDLATAHVLQCEVHLSLGVIQKLRNAIGDGMGEGGWTLCNSIL